MTSTTITCSRCQKIVNGLVDESIKSITVSSGFYQVDTGYWKNYARAGEKYVCDDCMFADPKYAKIYGIKKS